MPDKNPTFQVEAFQIVRGAHGYNVQPVGYREGPQNKATGVHFASNLHRRKASPNFDNVSDTLEWLLKNYKQIPMKCISNKRHVPDDRIMLEVSVAAMLDTKQRAEVRKLLDKIRERSA